MNGDPLNTAPQNWLHLVRAGDTLFNFTSADVITWTFVHAATLPNFATNLHVGHALTVYTSNNGTTWTPIGSTTLSGLPINVYVGLAVNCSSSFVLSTTTWNIHPPQPTPQV